MQRQVARGIADTATARKSPEATTGGRRRSGRGWSYALTSWLGLVPFLLFCLLFEILPAIIIIQGSFSNNSTGALTLANWRHLFSQGTNLWPFQTTISLPLLLSCL